MLQTTTLKRNLVPRFGKARKMVRFGVTGLPKFGGLPPLKETFVDILVVPSFMTGVDGFIILIF